MRHVPLQVRRLRTRLRQAPHHGVAPLVTRPILLLAVAGLIGAVACFLIDRRVSLAMLDEPQGVLAFLSIATDIGLVRWYLWPTLAIVGVLTLIDWSRLDREGQLRLAPSLAYAAQLFCSVAIAGIVTNILKVIFGRARPAFLDDLGQFDFHLVRFGNDFASFPSGHSTTMGAVTLTLMILIPQARVPLFIVGLCLALSRIVVRAHFPSDVVAGFTIGALTAILVARWMAGRGIGYRPVAGGRGWRGLLPERRSYRRFA